MHDLLLLHTNIQCSYYTTNTFTSARIQVRVCVSKVLDAHTARWPQADLTKLAPYATVIPPSFFLSFTTLILVQQLKDGSGNEANTNAKIELIIAVINLPCYWTSTNLRCMTKLVVETGEKV